VFLAVVMVGVLEGCGGSSATQLVPMGNASHEDTAEGGAEAGLLTIGENAAAAVVDASPSGPSGDDAGDTGAPAPTVVYVSMVSGADTYDGFSPGHAKKTIASGIVAATALSGGEVHVCKGVYPESALILNTAVSLKGGYDCATWVRTSGYGYPTFDELDETIVQNGDYAAQTATLLVSGSVPKTVVIDGFTIQGAPASVARMGLSAGIAVQDSASPVISNSTVTGGGGTQTSPPVGSTPGSIGVSVSGNASPELTMDRISGGTGSGFNDDYANTYGSAGVVLSGMGTPNVHDLTITGGIAASGGSVGLLSSVSLTKAAGNALTGATVSGAAFGGVPTHSSNGIDIEGSATAEITDCDVYGNNVGSGDASAIAMGVTSGWGGGSPSLLLLRARIYGGSNVVTTNGVWANGPLEMDNSMVHAGEGSNSTGVLASAGTLNFDTVYENGTEIGNSAVAGVGALALHDVLILGGEAGVAVYDTECSNVAALDHVVSGGLSMGSWCGIPTGQAMLSTTQLPSSRCAGSCVKALFGSAWGDDDGMNALFSTTQTDAGLPQKGWTFAAPPPCIIATAGAPVMGMTTDINGNARSSLPSVGATEVVGPCTP
jgi:hypothetical protein